MKKVESQESGVRSQKAKTGKKAFLALYSVFCILFLFAVRTSAFSAEKWAGVDEAVVKKIAGEHGREAKEPLINTDKGDLLLFVFMTAGVIGGFTAGYYWRKLTEGKRGSNDDNA